VSLCFKQERNNNNEVSHGQQPHESGVQLNDGGVHPNHDVGVHPNMTVESIPMMVVCSLAMTMECNPMIAVCIPVMMVLWI